MNTGKLTRFGVVYALVVAIIWVFDYLYMPWLGIKFQYLTIIPLFFSLLLVCWVGLNIYDFFGEDVFFIGKIKPWLDEKSSWRVIEWIKQIIRRSPKATFIAVSTFWSPLHGYLFFRTEDDNLAKALRKIVEGSVYCAIFWGIVISLLVLIWKCIKNIFT